MLHGHLHQDASKWTINGTQYLNIQGNTWILSDEDTGEGARNSFATFEVTTPSHVLYDDSWMNYDPSSSTLENNNNYIDSPGAVSAAANVSIASGHGLEFGTDDFSISFWLKADSVPTGYEEVFTNSTPGNTGNNWSISLNTDALCNLTINETTPDNFNNISFPFDDKWHHVVYTITNNGGNYDVREYLDSDLKGTTNIVKSLDSDSTDQISITTSYNGGNPFYGGIDTIGLYREKVLNQSEIDSLYNNGIGRKLNNFEEGLIWGSNCDTGEGTALEDVLGNVNGILAADSLWGAGGACSGKIFQHVSSEGFGYEKDYDSGILLNRWKLNEADGETIIVDETARNDGASTSPITSVFSPKGTGISFDYTSWITMPTNGTLLDYPFCLSIWVRIPIGTAAQTMSIFGLSDGRDNGYCELRTSSIGAIRMLAGDGVGVTVTPAGPVIRDGKWHNIVGVWVANNERKIYADGKYYATGTNSKDFFGQPTHFYIGRKDTLTPINYFSGELSDARVYSGILKDKQIQRIWNEGVNSWRRTMGGKLLFGRRGI